MSDNMKGLVIFAAILALFAALHQALPQIKTQSQRYQKLNFK